MLKILFFVHERNRAYHGTQAAFSGEFGWLTMRHCVGVGLQLLLPLHRS